METTFPLLFAAVVGFGHAFEADHLVAVGNIVTKRGSLSLAIKDGIYWGLGHSSIIFIIGLIIIVGKVTIMDSYFSYFEAVVGVMLVLLGLVRLSHCLNRRDQPQHLIYEAEKHHLAYGVGLVHGLAGSGAMILLVMTEIKSEYSSILYLIIFGIGSVLGMLVAAGIFSLPFSRRLSNSSSLQFILIILSSALCIGYGSYIVIQNLN